jgi:hypothetical protein
MAVAVSKPSLGQELIPLFEIVDHLAIRLLDILAQVLLSRLGGIPSVPAYRAEYLQMVVQPELIVLKAMSGSDVNASRVLSGDEVCGVYAMLYISLPGHQIEQRMLVLQFLHILGGKALQKLVVLVAARPED